MANCKDIVVKFVKEGHIDWSRDMKAASRLLKKFPNKDFWDWVEPYPLVPNLHFLQSKESLEILNNRYKLFLQQKDLKQSKEKLKESFDSKAAVSYNEENSKVGEDIHIVKKPRTLKEFLNYGPTPENTAT
jgi:hypothetical protein